MNIGPFDIIGEGTCSKCKKNYPVLNTGGPTHFCTVEDPAPSSIFFDIKGQEYCDEERALAQLLLDGVLFCNERETVDFEWIVKDGKIDSIDKNKMEIGDSTTVLFVNCNDLFWWGTADAEALPNDEIGRLYKMHMANKTWGSSKWCCLRRKLRPQVPIVEMMKKDGFWDAELEALPAPNPS